MENKINQEELMSLIMHPQSNAMTDEDFQVFSQRKPKKLEWLWKPYILRGNLNIVVGDGGEVRVILHRGYYLLFHQVISPLTLLL